jgi:hypothetical protein
MGEEPAPFMINYRVDDLDGLLASCVRPMAWDPERRVG